MGYGSTLAECGGDIHRRQLFLRNLLCELKAEDGLVM